MENPEELYSELDLKLMNVKQLQKLLKDNSLKVPKLKADMVKVLLENGLQKNGKILEFLRTVQPSTISSSTTLTPTMTTQIPTLIPTMTTQNVNENIENFNILGQDLPEEILVKICENMDLQSLGRVRTAYSRAYQACKGVILRRMAEVRRRMIEDFENRIRGMDLEVKVIAPDKTKVIVQIGRLTTNSIFLAGQEDTRNTAKFTQYTMCRSLNCLQNVEWPPIGPFTSSLSFSKKIMLREAAFNPNDPVLVRNLAEFLVDHGYERF